MCWQRIGSSCIIKDMITQYQKESDKSTELKQNYRSLLIQLLKNSKIAVMKKLNELQENTEYSLMTSE